MVCRKKKLLIYRLAWPIVECISIQKPERNSKSQRDNCTVCSSQLHSHCQAGETDGRVNEEICPQRKTRPWQEGNPGLYATWWGPVLSGTTQQRKTHAAPTLRGSMRESSSWNQRVEEWFSGARGGRANKEMLVKA